MILSYYKFVRKLVHILRLCFDTSTFHVLLGLLKKPSSRKVLQSPTYIPTETRNSDLHESLLENWDRAPNRVGPTLKNTADMDSNIAYFLAIWFDETLEKRQFSHTFLLEISSGG